MQLDLRRRAQVGIGIGDAGTDFYDSFTTSGSGEGGFFEGGSLPTSGAGPDYSSGEGLNIDTTVLAIGGGYVGAPIGGGSSSGYAGVTPVQGSTGINAAQLAAAIAAGTVVVSRSLPNGGKACPSGYATPQGVCVPVAGAGQILPGIPNQTLALGFGVLMLVMLMSGGGRR